MDTKTEKMLRPLSEESCMLGYTVYEHCTDDHMVIK